jgi:hypothetical protein
MRCAPITAWRRVPATAACPNRPGRCPGPRQPRRGLLRIPGRRPVLAPEAGDHPAGSGRHLPPAILDSGARRVRALIRGRPDRRVGRAAGPHAATPGSRGPTCSCGCGLPSTSYPRHWPLSAPTRPPSSRPPPDARAALPGPSPCVPSSHTATSVWTNSTAERLEKGGGGRAAPWKLTGQVTPPLAIDPGLGKRSRAHTGWRPGRLPPSCHSPFPTCGRC